MASPVSFGDAVVMAKMAKAIAQAFTTGRKSAPAEFREVENQLYSLSTALAAFQGVDAGADAVPPLRPSVQDGGQTIAGMLKSCYETLKHLEKIVQKYGIVGDEKDASQPVNRLRRWSHEIVKNYKKIAWTTEAGDLATLRSQLMVHTNSLDLVLGIIINSRTARIEESLKENSAKLSEIHSWWAENLKDSAAAGPPQPGLAEPSIVEPVVIFELHMETHQGLQLACPEASIHEDWTEDSPPSFTHQGDLPQIFSCHCNQHLSKSRPSPHRSRLEAIKFHPATFPFRQAGDTRVWTMYKTLDKDSNRLVSAVIKNMPIGDIADFEERFIQPLAEQRARHMHVVGVSNTLTHMLADDRIRLLNLQGDMRGLLKFVDSVAFTVGNRTLSKHEVEDLSLFHYREISAPGARKIGPDPGLDYAEVQIHYDQDSAISSGDITRSELRLKRNTKIRVERQTSVVLQGIECFGFINEDQTNRIETADVSFNMTTPESAHKLFQRFEEMRLDLFVLSLQYPSPDETVALHLQATQVQCEEICIADADMLITKSRQNKFRLIIQSRNRCTIMSQVLPAAFFTPESTARGTPNLASPTWVVQLESPGIRRVYHYRDGFKSLSFQSFNSERMFELGRAAISQANTALLLADDA